MSSVIVLQQQASSKATVAKPMGKGYFKVELESLRGIAALGVALFHSFHLLPVDGARVYDRTIWNLTSVDALMMRLIMIPFNGGAAVSLFFVLSGFVLALSLQRDDHSLAKKAASFTLRRFLRIYPALAINILLFSAMIAIFATLAPALAIRSFTRSQIIANLLLQAFDVNGATWSLMIELAAVPFLFLGYCVSRNLGVFGLIALLALSVIVLFWPKIGFHLQLGNFMFMFFVGMLTAEILTRKLMVLNRLHAIASTTAAITTLLGARFLLGYESKWSLLLEGFASAALISAILTGPRLRLHSLLAQTPVRFLGRISYGFYLYHPLALGIFVPLLVAMFSPAWLHDHPFLGSAAIAVATLAASIPMGSFSYFAVERTMIRISHRF